MKIKTYSNFNTKKSIGISLIPILDFGFENYYKHYNYSIELGWLFFGIYFEFRFNKKNS